MHFPKVTRDPEQLPTEMVDEMRTAWASACTALLHSCAVIVNCLHLIQYADPISLLNQALHTIHSIAYKVSRQTTWSSVLHIRKDGLKALLLFLLPSHVCLLQLCLHVANVFHNLISTVMLCFRLGTPFSPRQGAWGAACTGYAGCKSGGLVLAKTQP